jgi:hypothetical protein
METQNTTRTAAHRDLGNMIACSHCCTLHNKINGRASGCELPLADATRYESGAPRGLRAEDLELELPAPRPRRAFRRLR